MKKILSLIAVFFVLLGSALALVSCTENDSQGNITLVIATEEPQIYDISLSELSAGEGLIAVFEHLKAKEEFEYEIKGGFLEAVGGLENNYDLESYIYIFTSVEKDFDVSEYKMEIEYEGKTLVSSGVGSADMTIKDGAVIYITLVSFS